jgi:16S rRNA (guanine527-N7)-methyltransferase
VSASLIAALEDAQRLGFLGSRPIVESIDHARGFVRALDAGGPIESVVDLGAGGGLPGLVIANDRPTLRLTLLDRRAKRTDHLERVVRRLGWQERVTVVCSEVDAFTPDAPFDAAVARGFGPPASTLTAAARLVRGGGSIVISEPPDQDRWDDQLLEQVGVHRLDRPTPPGHVEDRQSTSSGLDGLVAIFIKR